MLWLLSQVAFARCPDIEVSADTTAEALLHANTLYWWARASGDDLALHCRAQAYLELALGADTEWRQRMEGLLV
ncbi:MAG TPA: hypothetical protein QGF58_09110 [Myxococcota bacterium]|nr:hypothetical protein [Myxococcota bacterium]